MWTCGVIGAGSNPCFAEFSLIWTACFIIPPNKSTVRWKPFVGCKRRTSPTFFVTNTTSRPRTALVEKLTSFGFEAAKQEILTPAVAAGDWLRSQDVLDVELFVRPSTREEFADVPCLPDNAARTHESTERPASRVVRNTAPRSPAQYQPLLQSGAEVLEVGSYLGAFLQAAEEWG